MAKVKNITPDVLSLFRAEAPPIHGADCPDPMCGDGCNEVMVRDENFVDRAWPKSTWEVIEAPELDGYVDVSTEEAWLWAVPEVPDAAPLDVQGKALVDMTIAELMEIVNAAGVDLGGATKKADIIAAIAAHKED